MRAAQKIPIALALAAIVCAVSYQAHLNSNLRRQIEIIQQQQGPLAERNQFLETELSNLTNQLADANQRFNCDTTDLGLLPCRNSRWRSVFE